MSIELEVLTHEIFHFASLIFQAVRPTMVEREWLGLNPAKVVSLQMLDQ